MQKLITFCVPCYNSQEYMEKCINSLLVCDHKKIEIIIINDGSKDNTLKIANEFKKKYPETIKVVDKENGGHGSGVNAGIKEATGLYYKVIDSDDWVDEFAVKTLVQTIENHLKEDNLPDCYFTNYVFEHVSDNTEFVAHQHNHFPANTMFSWKDVKRFKIDEFLMMHAICYKVSLLKECHLHLPEKTFYVDNVYVYTPMKLVKKMYYLDVDLYRYFIGRSDQSVNVSNMVKRYDQQLRVMRNVSLEYSLKELKALPRKHYKFMKHELVILSFLTLFFVIGEPSKKKDSDYKAYFKEFKEKNKALYYKIRYGTIFFAPWILIKPLRVWAAQVGYKLLTKKMRWGA